MHLDRSWHGLKVSVWTCLGKLFGGVSGSGVKSGWNLRLFMISRGGYVIQWFLMEGKGWYRSNTTYGVREDGFWRYKVTI